MELKLAIAQHLRIDRPALKALSLTSSSWVAPAQAVLFEVLQVHFSETKTLQNLVSLLKSTTPLGTYLKEAQLFCADAIKLDDLLSVVSMAPQLRSFVIASSSPFLPLAVEAGTTPVQNSEPRLLDTLALRICVIPLAVFHELLTSLVCAKLCLTGIDFILEELDITFPNFQMDPCLFSSLRSLDLGMVHNKNEHYSPAVSSGISCVLSACPDDLKSVGLRGSLPVEEALQVFNTFLQTKGSRIEDLRLDYSNVYMDDEEVPPSAYRYFSILSEVFNAQP